MATWATSYDGRSRIDLEQVKVFTAYSNVGWYLTADGITLGSYANEADTIAARDALIACLPTEAAPTFDISVTGTATPEA